MPNFDFAHVWFLFESLLLSVDCIEKLIHLERKKVQLMKNNFNSMNEPVMSTFRKVPRDR